MPVVSAFKVLLPDMLGGVVCIRLRRKTESATDIPYNLLVGISTKRATQFNGIDAT